MNWKTHKQQLLKNPEFRKALKETELEFQIARVIIEARIDKGFTQKELATKLHTKQSVISRVENAKTTPSLSFLKRIADALHLSLQIQFRPV
ncbi:MAG: helix-turn-helix transcriptional regulator [bacterium]|nr:helix-turn-helix transcriptional regulator [bacterium]